VVQPNVKAQQSVHFVLSNDYSFKMWDRPFKLVSGCIIISDVNTILLIMSEYVIQRLMSPKGMHRT
jgi:hypothetical protein